MADTPSDDDLDVVGFTITIVITLVVTLFLYIVVKRSIRVVYHSEVRVRTHWLPSTRTASVPLENRGIPGSQHAEFNPFAVLNGFARRSVLWTQFVASNSS